MAKEKVYKLAQEFKVSSEALVQMLRGMGIPVKSHMSTVDDSLRTEIKKKFELERAEIKKEYDRKKQMITKAREDMIGEADAENAARLEAKAPAVVAQQSAPVIDAGVSKPVEGVAPASPSGAAPAPAQQPPQSHERPRPYGGAQQSQQQNYSHQQQRPYQGGSSQSQGPQHGGSQQQHGGQHTHNQFGSRPPRPFDRDQRGGDRPQFGGDRGDRPQFNNSDRPQFGGDRPQRPPQTGGGDRPQFSNDRGPRPQFGGDRPQFGADRGPRPQFGGDRPQFGGDRPQFGADRGPRPSREGTYSPMGNTDLKFSDMPPPPPSPEDAARSFGKKDKKKGKTKKKAERPEIAELELKANIKKTLAKIGSGFSKKKYKKEVNQVEEADTEERKILNVAEFVTASEIANMIQIPVPEIITKCLELGLFVTINQRLDFETIELIVDEFGYDAQLMSEYAPDLNETDSTEEEEKKVPRAPVVTVMGHVDHGKTSLLDYIKKTNVMAGEAGGITQHIAAYLVPTRHGQVTFLDTPGHEAFTAMRARGSNITDIIVLVVAADSAVMPQTKEAIDHARAANVPIVVALNKIDLPTANPEKIKAELASYNVLVEEYGGQVSCVEISAKTGKNVDKLLEVLALETEILELKASVEGRAQGVIIESELDKGKGPIATILVQKGTLRKGDAFVTGIHHGRVRDLFNERGISVESAGPSIPVLVLGLSGTPQAGDSFKVVDDEKEAREIAARRRLAQREREFRHMGIVSLDHLYEQIKAGNMQTLNLIIKGDVDGSVEALAASLEKISTEEIKIQVIHKSVGAIKETDINLAASSNAIIIGFHLSPNTKIRELAKNEGVEIRTYKIIYEVLEDMRSAMEGMLKPEIKEKIVAEVVVRKVFKISKFGTVAGCYVESGTVTRGFKARLIRDDVILAEGKISTLRRIQDDVKEVRDGFECGLTIDSYSDYMENDRFEVYEEIEVARKLSAPL